MSQEGQGGPGSAGDLPDLSSARVELRRTRADALRPEPPIELTVTGTLRALEVEGGAWVLDTDAGARFQLLGDVDPAWSDRRLVVTGRLRADLETTAQVGPTLEIESVGQAPSSGQSKGPA